MTGIKLESKNLLEKELIHIRKNVSALPELARYKSFGVIYARILYIRDKADEIARELYRIENQEVLPSMIQLVKTQIVCEHTKEILLAYKAPLFRGDWVYLLRCEECGRYRKIQHRSAVSERTRRAIARSEEEVSTLETSYGLRQDN